ncbi:hypothetical protein BCR42DRAFT_489351 [Absidia repens]|uniref:FAR1 domain-containing protein n=1 Tax=Absidia repens TaxID=90262 RepID=A0A1X2IN09_9FUNG|nr:hypothetical protein BCR42DRAFT_489351 [Absidia repens]
MTEQNVLENNDRSANISLDSFYADVLSKKFNTSVEAIDYCRKLCAQFGFTIKQEQSTYRNIYVYCSREGFPDSLRNPKSNPKRRRPSKRCDCKWRITLNEQNGNLWEFRKSLNPDASKHNHELMRPEEIDNGWPKEMLDLISDLTRQRMATPEIRSRVQLLYAHVPWNERRFYNRLSEERQKLRVLDAQARVQQLQGIWSNLVTASAASQELTDMAVTELNRMVDQLCGITQTDPTTLPPARLIQQQQQQQQHVDHEVEPDMEEDLALFSSQDAAGDSSQDELSKPTSTRKRGTSPTLANTPKGYTAVVIPQQIYYVKLHPQRVLQDVQQLNRRRSRSFAFPDPLNANVADASSTTSTSSSLSNQQKRQKTPMLMEIAQQQQQQPPIISSPFATRQTETQHHRDSRYPHQFSNMPVNEQPPSSSNFIPPPSSHRDSNYYASTLYPMYPQPTQRYMTGHPQHYQQQQHQQQHQQQQQQRQQQDYLPRVDHDPMYATTGFTMTSNQQQQHQPINTSTTPSPSSHQHHHANAALRTTPTSFDPITTPTPNQGSASQSLHALPPPPPPLQPDYMIDHHVQPAAAAAVPPEPPMHPPGFSSFQSSSQQHRIYYDPNNQQHHPNTGSHQ